MRRQEWGMSRLRVSGWRSEAGRPSLRSAAGSPEPRKALLMTTEQSTPAPAGAELTRTGNGRPSPGMPLKTEHGSTTIADTVVTKVAGIAAREVGGVHELGGGMGRAIAGMTQRVGIGDE